MRLAYTVHGVANAKVTKEVQLDGKSISAEVDAIIVELLAADGSSTQLRFIGDQRDAAKGLFVQDAVVYGEFSSGAQASQ